MRGSLYALATLKIVNGTTAFICFGDMDETLPDE
jgi:hypothetical protein